MKSSSRFIFVMSMVSILAFVGMPVFGAAPTGGSSGPCTVNNATGVPLITPPDCTYRGPGDLRHGQGDVQALRWTPRHRKFFDIEINQGGVFNGSVDTFQSEIEIEVTGTGPLEGYAGTVSVSAKCEAHAGPWSVDEKPISFETEMMRIEGELAEGSDSDFSYLRITGGSENGFPSPGHTTATTQDGETYVVDSVFEMGYRIEYVGAEGGPLEGYRGEFEGTAVMKAYANAEDRN